MRIAYHDLRTCVQAVQDEYPGVPLVIDCTDGSRVLIRAEHYDVPEARGEILACIEPDSFTVYEDL